MREYVVYRMGWSEVNQAPDRGLPEKMPVVRVFADSPEEACRTAAQTVSLTANQQLTAEPADVVDVHEANLNISPRSAPE